MKAAASRRSVVEVRSPHPPETLVLSDDERTFSSTGLAPRERADEPRAGPVSTLAPFATATACAGDHPSVFQLLTAVLQRPSPAEFQSQLEDPNYQPQDRLLMRRADQLVGHARLIHRQIRFGPAELDTAVLCDMAVLHEYRGRGCGSMLLRSAERRMVEAGAVAAVLRTRSPQFFRRRGWCVAARHSYSVARPAGILAHLRETASPQFPLARREPAPLSVRLWRQVERDAVMRLYQHNTANAYGPPARSDLYWPWLLNRGAYDCLYIAIQGPDNFPLDESQTTILGYAVMREGRIVELMASPSHSLARQQLLVRACRDAMEHDLPALRVDAAPDDPVHDLFCAARGDRYYHEADDGEVFLLKVLDPQKLLLHLDELLHRRARDAQLPPTCGLGLQIADRRFRITVRPAGLHIGQARAGRTYLRCGPAEFTQLALGHLDVREAAAAGRITASTPAALEIAAALFPRIPLWFPPWDDLRAG